MRLKKEATDGDGRVQHETGPLSKITRTCFPQSCLHQFRVFPAIWRSSSRLLGAKFSKVPSIVALHSECNRVLTFQNVCQAIAGILTMSCVAGVFYFWIHSHMMAENLSSPSIMILGRTQKGEPIMIDDFRHAYSYGKRDLFIW